MAAVSLTHPSIAVHYAGLQIMDRRAQEVVHWLAVYLHAIGLCALGDARVNTEEEQDNTICAMLSPHRYSSAQQ